MCVSLFDIFKCRVIEKLLYTVYLFTFQTRQSSFIVGKSWVKRTHASETNRKWEKNKRLTSRQKRETDKEWNTKTKTKGESTTKDKRRKETDSQKKVIETKADEEIERATDKEEETYKQRKLNQERKEKEIHTHTKGKRQDRQSLPYSTPSQQTQPNPTNQPTNQEAEHDTGRQTLQSLSLIIHPSIPSSLFARQEDGVVTSETERNQKAPGRGIQCSTLGRKDR